MSRGDLLHHKLGQRGDALVRAVFPQPVCHEILKGQSFLPQTKSDANKVSCVFYGAADYFVSVLRGKQMLRERCDERLEKKKKAKNIYILQRNSLKQSTEVYANTCKLMQTYQPAEATVKDAESSLVIRNLHEALYISVVIGAHHSVGVGVDLVDASRCHL